jgi:rubrerythrin
MKHWTLDQVAWDRFDPSLAEPELVPLVKAAALVEHNGNDYATYLCGVFHDDPDFQQAARNWAVEEVQHGQALGRWGRLADPEFEFDAAFTRFREGYKLPLSADTSVRGTRTGELIARCMVETGTSSYYSALADATKEPVLEQICRLIAADEYRHFKLFYDHMKRYLAREKLGVIDRLRIALGRITETEDDELAFAFHCANSPRGADYRHDESMAGYLARAIAYYRPHHVQRGTGMILKAVGLPPRGRFSDLAARGGYALMQRRRRKMERILERAAADGRADLREAA